jgi:hypothetical protein
VEEAKRIMRSNFIGPEELKNIKKIHFNIPETLPQITYSIEELNKKKDNYILILGLSYMNNGVPVTIRNMKDIFGNNPEMQEPCFYNQDWYDAESFVDFQMNEGWYLIRKDVFEDSRAVQPQQLMEKYCFPKAITCTYSFFICWLCLGVKLWYHDFVWCSDVDHNGDRIYVGKYHDVDGINKNGFSIHRHLALRSCYACID